MSAAKNKPFEKRYITVEEASAFLGISTVTCYRYIKEGVLQASRLRTLIRIDKLWLEKFMAGSAREKLFENRPQVQR
jgi:excisionase family DNA binding protein